MEQAFPLDVNHVPLPRGSNTYRCTAAYQEVWEEKCLAKGLEGCPENSCFFVLFCSYILLSWLVYNVALHFMYVCMYVCMHVRMYVFI